MVLFFIGYYRACSKFPCVTQWVLATYFINRTVILHAPHLCILVTGGFLSKSSWAIGSFVSNFSLYLEVISLVSGEYNLLSSVSFQQKFEAMEVKALDVTQLSDRVIALGQISVTALCYSSLLCRK